MAVDLPPEKAARLAVKMLRLHADFRQRHGLPPVPSAWTVDEDFEEARRHARLNEPDVLRSPRPVIGPAIEGTRRIAWKLLKPVFDRQTEMNRLLLRVLDQLVRDREDHRHIHYDLSVRVAQLERQALAERESERERRDREA
jgi:hypothetical protein